MIKFTQPNIGDAEIEAVTNALRMGHLGGNGPISARVQARLCELTGAPHCLLTPSATHAMELALMSIDLAPGDEVLMPSFAFVSQATAILSRGAVPVFCEIDPRTLNMCPADAETRITDRTRVIMPVHYAGIACDLDAFEKLAKKHDLLLFEDAAQGLGSLHRGRHLGTVGVGGCISFHATKNAVCGEGGVFLMSSDELYERAAIVQEKGTNRSAFLRGEVDRYTWVDQGGNFTMSDLLAALLEVQLDRLDEMQATRSAVWNTYDSGLEELEKEGLILRPAVPHWAQHNAHLYYLQARQPGLQMALLTGLRARGIEASFHFQPLHASPFARQKLGLDQSLPITERAAFNLVRLPLHSMMTTSDAETVVDEVRAIVRSHMDGRTEQ